MRALRASLIALLLTISLAAWAEDAAFPYVDDSAAASGAPFGTLKLAVAPEADDCRIDGYMAYNGTFKLKPGKHVVEIMKIDYEFKSQEFTIAKDETLELKIELEKILISIRFFYPSSYGFSTLDPVPRLELFADISAPANCYLSILDEKGEEVWSATFQTTAEGRVGISWDGRDSKGVPVPPGKYKIDLYAAHTEKKGMPAFYRLKYEIKPPHAYIALGSFEGTPGLSFCPIILPDNGVEANYGFMGTLASGIDGALDGALAPYMEGSRLGVVANTGGVALSGDVALKATGGSYDLDAWAYLGLGPLYVAGKLVSLNGTTFGFVEQARGGFCVSFGWPAFRFAISPEVLLDAGTMRLYGRAQAAIAVAMGGVQLGFSSRLQTGDLLTTFLADPVALEAGAEVGVRLGGYFWLIASFDMGILPAIAVERAGLSYRLMF